MQRSPLAGPDHVGVLGRQHAELAADRHQPLVLLLSARARPSWSGMVHRSWLPGTQSRRAKRVGEDAEGEAEMLLGLADVARQDQPVVGVRPQGPQGLAGHLVAEVQVGDRVELHQLTESFRIGIAIGSPRSRSARSRISSWLSTRAGSPRRPAHPWSRPGRAAPAAVRSRRSRPRSADGGPARRSSRDGRGRRRPRGCRSRGHARPPWGGR